MLLVAALGLCAPAQTVNVPVGFEARLWVGPLGRATADAREALALLARAREEGLDPDDYDAAGLHRAAGLLEGPESSPADIAAFEKRLTTSVAQYVLTCTKGASIRMRSGSG